MFNKQFKVKSNSATKGTDKKRLQRKIVQMFPAVSEAAVGSMLPSKAAVQTVKLVTHSDQTVLVYVVDGEPLFVDNDGFVFPTIYTLWKWPHVLGCITTWPPVLKKLQNGASLMLPGVILPEDGGMDFTALEKDQLCAINLTHNMCAVCVGMTTMSGRDMIMNGMKGKGVTILHCYGDHLWLMGSKTELPHISMPVEDTLEDLESSFNALMQQKVDSGMAGIDSSGAFMSQVSFKLNSMQKDEEFDLADQSPLQELGSLPPFGSDITDQTSGDDVIADPLLVGDDTDNVLDGMNLLESSSAIECQPFSLGGDACLLEDGTTEKDTGNDQQGIYGNTSELVVHTAKYDSLLEHTTPSGTMYCNDTSVPPEEHDPRKSMDSLLMNCFLHSLKHRVTASDLPLLTSTFYKAHMIPSCPEGLLLDVKKSSYKKLSRFLEDMQHKGLVEVKELTKGVESIVSFNRAHPELKSYRRLPGIQSGNVAATISKASTSSQQHLLITELVMPSAHVLPLFAQRRISKEAYLKISDAKEVLTDYIRSHDLVDKVNNRLVVLDPLLCDVLRKKGTPPDERLTWQEATQRLIELMRPAHSIQWPGRDPAYRKGKCQPIKLVVCQRASNKKVTLVDNLECYGISPNDFAHSMQRIAAASTTTIQLPGKSAGIQALVQGNTAKLATKIINEQYGIPLRYIDISDTVKHKVSTQKKHK